jgi:hypothetical protein
LHGCGEVYLVRRPGVPAVPAVDGLEVVHRYLAEQGASRQLSDSVLKFERCQAIRSLATGPGGGQRLRLRL